MHLSALFIYPVKSLRGCSLAECNIDSLGLVGDRRFMVVDETGRFLTQRAVPKMALIETAISDLQVTLSLPRQGSLHVSTVSDATAPVRTVSVWGSSGLEAEDCGDAAAHWLSSALSLRCRLVRIGARFRRPVAPVGGEPSNDLVSFADAYPFLVLGESSLGELNDRLLAQGGEALDVVRFRPNLLVNGSAPYDEDRWARFRIGNVVFRTSGPCARCTVTTIDPSTGERSAEPLRTLAGYRRNPAEPSEVCFGQNAVHVSKSGTVRVGDRVEVIE